MFIEWSSLYADAAHRLNPQADPDDIFPVPSFPRRWEPDIWGQDPLVFSAKYQWNDWFEQAYISKYKPTLLGAATKGQHKGQTPLHLALSKGNMALAQSIMAKAIKANHSSETPEKLLAQQDASGFTPLHYLYLHRPSFTEEMKAQADAFIARHATPKTQGITNRAGQTPEQLGKEPHNFQKAFGATALHMLVYGTMARLRSAPEEEQQAILEGFKGQVRVLIEKEGSEVLTQEDYTGTTPADFLINMMQPKLLAILLEYSPVVRSLLEFDPAEKVDPVVVAAVAFPRGIQGYDEKTRGPQPDHTVFWLLYEAAKRENMVIDYSRRLGGVTSCYSSARQALIDANLKLTTEQGKAHIDQYRLPKDISPRQKESEDAQLGAGKSLLKF